MKYEEVIEMLKAGFSVDEIREMEKEPEEPTKTEDPKDETSETTAEIPNEFTEAVSEMREMFSDLKREIQAMNILNSKIDLPDENKQIEDLIANIINPFDRSKDK